MQKLSETTVSSEMKHKGLIINVRKDTVEINGKTHFREVVEHPGGVVIVPITDENELILIKQWRHPIGQALIELPAGKLEKGEDVLISAKRELREETGFSAKKWEELGFTFTTPGFCNEKLYLFKATDLTAGETDFDDGEIIHTFKVSFDKAAEMIKSGEITDAKTIIGICLCR